MLGNRVVALGDILGFTGTVLSNPVERVVEGPLKFVQNALDHSMRHAGWPSVVPTLKQLQSHPTVGFAWFSDTILLYAREDTDEANTSVIETAAWLLFESMHAPRSQMRFAIDYDEIYIDEANGVYVGQAVVHTAQLEKCQQWAGGALTDAAARRLRDTAASAFTIAYPVPLKGKGDRQGVAVNWAFAPHPQQPDLPPRWSSSSPAPTEDDFTKFGSIATKWLNTKRFHDFACVDHGSSITR